MEKYLAQTQALLGMIQATISEEELKQSSKAGEEMWKEIRGITDNYQLNIQEMLNAILSCHYTILEAVNEQIHETKKEEQ
ncbi:MULTISPECIES: hypothetical protein [Bacillus]|jgi:hypothetical protein|uniref:Uncharacterized protein n=1 Tax=Bacillus cereus (strain G9842) TaxID=405531 RepID=B7IZP2_BACC2|nr:MULTISPECIES: hypothetical protein [Bacillus]MBS9805867.1 hypothetical protein [Bacillus toyonensis]ACK98807.1 hypothetical protein BCG9842_A0049 [Bacillus cereus G9842]KUF34413.1 hypothetical protein AMR94_02105 [Bacillus sp. G3(2015)]MCU5508301.1 hypothetical protein [Bacillus cereus]MDA1951620.1 hypothetical protein [Bacillus cereus]